MDIFIKNISKLKITFVLFQLLLIDSTLLLLSQESLLAQVLSLSQVLPPDLLPPGFSLSPPGLSAPFPVVNLIPLSSTSERAFIPISKMLDNNMCLRGNLATINQALLTLTGPEILKPISHESLHPDTGISTWISYESLKSMSPLTETEIQSKEPEKEERKLSLPGEEARGWYEAPGGQVILSSNPDIEVAQDSRHVASSCTQPVLKYTPSKS